MKSINQLRTTNQSSQLSVMDLHNVSALGSSHILKNNDRSRYFFSFLID